MAERRKVFKTEFQKERRERDLAILKEYNALMAMEGQSRMCVNEHLMRKYGVHSTGTIYVIRRRAEEALRREEERGK